LTVSVTRAGSDTLKASRRNEIARSRGGTVSTRSRSECVVVPIDDVAVATAR
jgi:hypothetical protein